MSTLPHLSTDDIDWTGELPACHPVPIDPEDRILPFILPNWQEAGLSQPTF